MRAISFTSLGFILGTVLAAGPAAQAQQDLTLPEVTVTAPATQSPQQIGPTSQSAPGNPYYGNVRVEEALWPVIPCASSRVGASTSASCRRGPAVMNFEHGDANGTRAMSNCQIAHDLVIDRLGGLQFEADSLVFDPYYVSAIGHQRQDCYVEAIPRKLREQLIDMNHVTRQATSWGSFQESGDLSTYDFTVGPDTCLAFEKRGPRWGGGYIYLIHAAICRKDGQPVDRANIETVLAALHIEQHDPNGNLR